MTKEYTGFAISNFRSGFNESVEPWLLPRDSFQVLQNAHLYRGVVEKIAGYLAFARMSYRSELVIATGSAINGSTKTFTYTLPTLPTTGNTIIQSTVNSSFTLAEVFQDDGNGNLTSQLGGTGTLNYATGAISVTFNSTPVKNPTSGFNVYNSVIVSYDSAPSVYVDIMGIKPFIAATGTQQVIVFDTTRMGIIVPLANAMAALQQLDYGISEVPNSAQTLGITTGFNNTKGPFNGTSTPLIVPGTIQFQIFDSTLPTANLLDTITDNGAGLLTGATLDATKLNLINYGTGAWIMTFTVNQPSTNSVLFSAGIYGNTFSGDFTDFFSVANYQGLAFITNSIDPPMYYNGTQLQFLNTNLTAKPNTIAPYDLTKVLHVVINRERLLLLSVFESNIPQLNYIYWSTFENPLNFTNDEYFPAPTSEPIRAQSFINSDLVVRFSNSERVFRYTGDAFAPFRWDSTNVLWRCDASFSAINYDSWFSSVGLPAIVGSDGVNVKRVDEIIPDFTLNQRIAEEQPVLSIDQNSIGQCYGERFDDFKEGWLCYKAYDGSDISGEERSDTVLAFNYLDSTYAVYTFPFSCLGFGRITPQADTWSSTFTQWQQAFFTWDSYSQSDSALLDLAGDRNGIVYELGVGSSITDINGNVIPCLFEAITKDFNPFVDEGQLARFGYVDFLMSSNDDTTIRVQFYKDNQLDDNFDSYYQESIIQLTGNTQSKVWKRIYVGAVGKSHTMRIYQNSADFVSTPADQPIRMHAMVVYFKAAGRIFS